MPLQNRITPFGKIVSVRNRGLFMGNRGGKIHDPATKTLLKRQWASKQWICCVIQFRNRQRTVMGKGYTELFFLDEVTALSAGHRPCFECRRQDALTFAASWAKTKEMKVRPMAREMDDILHRERQISGVGKTGKVEIGQLPNGAMVEIDDTPFAIKENYLLRWSQGGYDQKIEKARYAEGSLLTPPKIVEILHAGYLPHWHPSAARQLVA